MCLINKPHVFPPEYQNTDLIKSSNNRYNIQIFILSTPNTDLDHIPSCTNKRLGKLNIKTI